MSKKKSNLMTDRLTQRLRSSYEAPASSSTITSLGIDDDAAKSGKEEKLIDLDKLRAADDEWNFFPKLPEDKMIEMMFSILENGLFNAIIVWEQMDGTYTILSGHNRVECYRRILNEYREVEDFDEDEFKQIRAIVYGATEIDEIKAKEIIIDTNYIQRRDDPRLLPTIIKNRMEIVKDRKDIKGRTLEVVAEELGLSRTKVYEDYIIYEKLIEEFREMYYDRRLLKKGVLKLTWFDFDTQRWLYDNYKERITNEKLLELSKGYNKEILHRLFTETKENRTVSIKVDIPKESVEKFESIVNLWNKLPEAFEDELIENINKWLKEKELN